MSDKDAILASLTLRPIRDKDKPFLSRLYASTRQEELAQTGWPQHQIDAFLAQQFEFQHLFYSEQFQGASFDVVQHEGVAVGRFYVDRRADEIRIIDIAFLPEYRGRGFGASLMRRLIAEAHGSGKPVRIHVEKNNPAHRLYERLGFLAVGDTGVYDLMECPPPGKEPGQHWDHRPKDRNARP